MSPLTKKNLFWDTDLSSLDLSKHKRYIIERILKFGNFSDYSWLKNSYSEDDIKKVITRNRSELDNKSLNFWSHIYKVNTGNFHASRNFK